VRGVRLIRACQNITPNIAASACADGHHAQDHRRVARV